MKDKLKKIGNVILKGLTVTIALTLVVGIIGVVLNTGGALIALTLAGAIISIPIFVVSSAVASISQSIQFRNFRKKKLNELRQTYEYQKEYAEERVNNIQAIKTDDNEIIYAEELIPINEEKLSGIKTCVSNDIHGANIVTDYEITKEKILREKNKSNLQKLKQDLTSLSFKLQDLETSNNTFLKNCNTTEELYEKKEAFQKIKTMNN